MNKNIKNLIVTLGCSVLFISSMIQGVSLVNKDNKPEVHIQIVENVNQDEVSSAKKGEFNHKSWEEGSFDDIKKSVLEFLNAKIKFIEDEIVRAKEDKDNERLKSLEKKLSKVKNVQELVQKATTKDEIKEAMHNGMKRKSKKNKH